MYCIEMAEGVYQGPDDLSQAELDSLGDALYYSTDRNGLPHEILKVSATAEVAISNFMEKWGDNPLITADLMSQLLAV